MFVVALLKGVDNLAICDGIKDVDWRESRGWKMNYGFVCLFSFSMLDICSGKF